MNNKIRIMLDPGHYGYCNRSPVVPEYYESRRMWLLTEYLAEELAAYGFEVFKTRNDVDMDVPIVARGEMAKDCDLFLSMHSNAVGEGGSEKIDSVHVYGAYDNLNNSHELAKMLADAIADCMGVSGGSVQTRKSENGDWEYYGVLRGARSVGCPLYYIIEHSFHTNPEATRWLMNDNNLKQLAEIEADTIAQYFGVEKPIVVGDVNGDGEIDALDYVLAKRICLGTYTPTAEELKRCDIDGDGKVSVTDYILIKRKVLGSIPQKVETIVEGDKVRIKQGVTKYANGTKMDSWVTNGVFYVRAIEQSGEIYLISTEAQGDVYTGRVRSEDVEKID